MKLLSLFCIFVCSASFAQLPLDESQFYARIKPGTVLPEKLLASKTAVFYPYTMTQKDLALAQQYFQRAGIDAVVYLESDLLMAGRDVSVNMAQYLNAREIANLIVFQKTEGQYKLTLFEYNRKANFIEADAPTWVNQNRVLEEILKTLYLAASNGGLKRENNLINDVAESGSVINAIEGRRNEFYAIDLKVDPLAVPKFGDEALDKQLEEIMKAYPFKYTLTDAGLSEAELRKQGYLFVLRFVKARAKVAKQVLGYDVTKAESAIVSISYTGDQPELRNISVNADVYKYYFKHIDSGNVYLGTKWDADEYWQQAIVNQLRGMKIELKIP
ncbi:MAG TPA: hypothetical protein VGD31_11595 [Sphingobacteriaceae bacterium]